MIKNLLKVIRIKLLKSLKFPTWNFKGSFYCGYNGINDVKNATIGNRVYIGNKFHLAVDSLDIGDHTLLASNVSIVGGDHLINIPKQCIRDTIIDSRPGVIIGKDCWIGHGTIILSGVKIGDGAVIGSGSIVVKDIPSFSVAVGNPAKVIKMRFSEDNINEHKKFLKSLK